MASQPWIRSNVAQEIHLFLRRKEMSMNRFYGSSRLLSSRRYIVDWLAAIWEEKKLSTMTRHLAITLLDFLMDGMDIDQKQLNLIAVACLLVASKFEEAEINIPRAKDLNTHLPGTGFTNYQYMQAELIILKFFDWNVGLVSPAHFGDYYLSFVLHPRTIVGITEMDDKMSSYVKKYHAYFLEVILQDHMYHEFLPSLVGAASVAATRMCLCLEPSWPKDLEAVTGYTVQELAVPVQRLLNTHSQDEQTTRQRAAVVAGYKSSSLNTTPTHSGATIIPATPDSGYAPSPDGYAPRVQL